MFAAILAIALTARNQLPIVDVCEINETPTVRQIILYRWTWLPAGRSHHVAQWWLVNDEPIVERRGGVWTVTTDGRRFVARSLRRTKTQHDPEILDRKKLHEMDREPYLCSPH